MLQVFLCCINIEGLKMTCLEMRYMVRDVMLRVGGFVCCDDYKFAIHRGVKCIIMNNGKVVVKVLPKSDRRCIIQYDKRVSEIAYDYDDISNDWKALKVVLEKLYDRHFVSVQEMIDLYEYKNGIIKDE